MSVFDRNMRRLRYDPEPWAGSGGGQNVSVEGTPTVGVVNLTSGAAGLPAGAVAVFFRQSGASPTLVGGHVAPFSGATGIAAGAPGAVPAPSAGQQDNLLAGSGSFSVATTSAGRSLLSAADAAAQRAFLGLGTAAVHPASDFVSAGAVTTSGLTASATDVVVGRASAGGGALEEIPCTAAGRAILAGVDAAAQRTTLGLGTAATHAATDFALASHTHDAADIVSGVLAIARLAGGTPTGKKFVRDDSTLQQVQYSDLANVATDKVLGRATAGTGAVELVDCTAAGRALIDDADATAQRATLGLGTAATHPATDFASSGLATASGLTTSATDVVLGRSSAGGGALQEVPCTATGRSIIAAASAAAVRTFLGVAAISVEGVSAAGDLNFTSAATGLTTDYSNVVFRKNGTGPTNVGGSVSPYQVCDASNPGIPGGIPSSAAGDQNKVLTAGSWWALLQTASIALNAVDFAHMQQVATDNLLGRATAGTGNVELVSCTAAGRALIAGASSSAQRTTLGLGTAATHAATDFALAGLATASGLTTSATDVLVGRSSSGGGAVEEVACTAAGRALIAGASASAQRTTLGLGTAAVANVVDFQTEAPVRFSPGLQNATLATATRSMTKNVAVALYMGRAPFACTSVDFLSRVTTLGSGFTACEVGVATGAVVMNGNATLTIQGTKVLTAIYNSTGVKNTTGVSVTLAAGADVWLVLWVNATTVPILRAASLADDLQLGYQQSLSTSTALSGQVGTPTAYTVEGATILPFFLGIKFNP